MIKTIIFDLSEVLLTGLKELGIFLENANVFGNKKINLLDKNLDKLLYGEITENEYWQNLISKHRLPISVAYLKRSFRKNIKEIPGSRKLIIKLKKNKYRLGLLSDHAREWINYIEKKFLYACLFDEIYYSFDAGTKKNEGKIFKIMLDRMGSIPKETLFIDDSKTNIKIAKKIGIKCIRFTDSKNLIKKFQKFNISIK